MQNKKAFITGITGQDGYYLTKFLLEKDYEIHGLIRRNSLNSMGHVEDLNIIPHTGDLVDSNSIFRILRTNKFDEIYHLGAQTFVKESFNNPSYTMEVNTGGTLNLLSATKALSPTTKIYNAATSEMFGNAKMRKFGKGKDSFKAYDETCNFEPCSPYGVSKLAAYQLCQQYRNSYNIFVSNGILMNHESPKRGKEFVTRKIILGMIKYCKQLELGSKPTVLVLGNLSSYRDWGFSGDYVEAMWKILQHGEPDDFVIATGKSYSVEDFCHFVIDNLQKRFNFEEPLKLQDMVATNDDNKRPMEVDYLRGNPAKAFDILGWEPETKLIDLIDMMIEADI